MHRGIVWRRESCSVVKPNNLIYLYLDDDDDMMMMMIMMDRVKPNYLSALCVLFRQTENLTQFLA